MHHDDVVCVFVRVCVCVRVRVCVIRTLGRRVREVSVTTRLDSTPCIVTDHESGAMRRMMKMVEHSGTNSSKGAFLPPQVLQVNCKHPVSRLI